MATYTPNYNLSKPEATDDFDAFRASYGDNMDKIDLNMGGGGGGGGHTIVDPTGTDMPQENKLQFTGAVNVSDDAVNGQTVVDIEGGGNYYLNTLYSTEEKKVGYWTDNKPLYQKTWFVPKSSLNSGETTYTHGDDLHIDNLVSVEGAVGNSRPLVEYHSSSAWACSIYNIGNNAFWIYLGSSVYSNMSASSYVKVTLRYTKTTDTADPNPQTGGVIYLPTIYSTEEREIGVWTDGKPLYQKTVHISALPDSSHIGQYVDYPHGIADVENIIDYEGLIRFSNGTSLKFVRLGFTISAFTPSTSIDSYCNQTNIRIMCGSDRSSASADYTIWYTKTTDVAGSGSWTPSGAKAVHYSFTEHIVGTWFGETLWEKTIQYVSSAGQADTDKVIDTSIRHGTNCYVVDLQGIQTYGYLRNNGTSPTPNATSDPEPLSQGTLYLPFYGGASMNSAHIYLYSDGIHFKKRGGSANANSIILTVRYVKI